MKNEGNDGRHCGIDQGGIARAITDHVLKDQLKFLFGFFWVDVLDDGLRFHFKQIGHFFQRSAFDSNPVEFPGLL